MKMTNLGENFGPILEKYFLDGSKPIYIISPFISIDTISHLLDGISDAIIVTSWRKDHLISGVSSLDLYPFCKMRGWSLFINSKLHAKIYSNGLDNCYIGSANCTNTALYSEDGNIECMLFVDILDKTSRVEINTIINNSICVDDSLYNKYVEWFSNLNITDNLEFEQLDDEFDKSNNFTIFNLPASSDPRLMYDYLCSDKFEEQNLELEHDISIYGSLYTNLSKDEYLDQCKLKFFENKFIKLISNQITAEGISFGSMSHWIHNNCTDIPVPYRSDVKFFVGNLFSWFTILDSENYEIKVPRHSEILFKI